MRYIYGGVWLAAGMVFGLGTLVLSWQCAKPEASIAASDLIVLGVLGVGWVGCLKKVKFWLLDNP